MIRQIEEFSINAWPSLRTLHYDGWLLRFANGYTRRANSVNPLYESTLELSEKVAYCEQFYSSRRQSTVFKMTSAAQPQNLDDYLAQQGYSREAETSVQTLNLAGLDSPVAQNVLMDSRLTEGWLDAFCRLNNVDNRHI